MQGTCTYLQQNQGPRIILRPPLGKTWQWLYQNASCKKHSIGAARDLPSQHRRSPCKNQDPGAERETEIKHQDLILNKSKEILTNLRIYLGVSGGGGPSATSYISGGENGWN